MQNLWKVDFYSSISLSGSGSGFRIRIRIQNGNLDPDPKHWDPRLFFSHPDPTFQEI